MKLKKCGQKSARIILFWGLLIIFLMACSGDEQTPDEVNLDSPLPTPTLAASIAQSPLATPVAAIPERGPDFMIDPIVKPGDTRVQGSGPPGLGIRIVDVSMVGEIRGEGTIGEDGRFDIEVSPVRGGNVLGVLVSALNDTGLIAEDFRNNDNYRIVPIVGLVVASYKVPQE